ncbi:MAG TPA: hypothetical protein VGV59_09985 [Pyrinomonadaceae bacterium]|nr:hypothetical protein [Pyrinomonadaceae bacterium]
MPRREAYTAVFKTNQIRAAHVKGMSDVTFKGFQCLNSDCTEFLFIRRDELEGDFEFKCPTCGMEMGTDYASKFYDYDLIDKRDNSIIESGEFTIPHSAYIAEALEYKYCIICNTMKPLHLFDAHGSRQSGRQGECRLCKGVYNSIKNQTRTSDQHRDASQLRRLRMDLAAGEKIDSQKVYERYDYKCFKCGKDLSTVTSAKERPLDHTLPAYYLWPLTTANATLLCQQHNGEKSGKWPSKYYNDAELRKLSVMTGIDYEILAGEPHYNPDALAILSNKEQVEALLTKYSAYIEELIKLRNRLLRETSFDFFKVTNKISPTWVQQADDAL